MIEAANNSGGAPVAAPDDGSVIEALRRGDKIAFAHLVDHYHASLRRVARLYISNRAVADEVVQDTWLGVIQGMWAFEGRSSVKTWIFRILINRVGGINALHPRSPPRAPLPCRPPPPPHAGFPLAPWAQRR
jgi:RNA polymerase sigma-70 factor (ECF subfamily)